MTNIRVEFVDGAVRQTWGDDGMYREYDETGTVVNNATRTFNDEENVWLTMWKNTETISRNTSILSDKVAAQVPDLLAMIEGLRARLDIPKDALTNTELRRTIKDVRVLARDVIQLARLVGNVLDSTDSGTP